MSVIKIIKWTEYVIKIKAFKHFIINQNDNVYLAFYHGDGPDPITSFHTPACGANNLPQCPIKGGTDFSIPFSVQVPDLPEYYTMVIVIQNPDSKPLGCAYTVVWDHDN